MNKGEGMKVNSWVISFLLSFAFITLEIFPAHAQGQMSNIESTDGRLTITETFLPTTQWVWIKVSKDLSGEDIFVPVVDGQMTKTFYLRFGPGQYNIQIHYTSDSKKYGSYYTLKKYEISNLDTRDLSFLLPSEQVQSEDPQIVALAEKLLSGVENELDKVKIIHDFVAQQLAYDYASYNDGTYNKKSYDALSVLRSGVSVCAGYANLFAAIGRAAQLRVAVVHGKGVTTRLTGNHAWNEVLINNEWKSVDVTWDDMETLRYKYFLPSEEEFTKDHLEREVRENY